MKYRRTAGFQKLYEALPTVRQNRVDQTMLKLELAIESGSISAGLGLKRLKHDFWEIRAGIFDRVVFQRRGGLIEFSTVGTHDDVRRFLKNKVS